MFTCQKCGADMKFKEQDYYGFDLYICTGCDESMNVPNWVYDDMPDEDDSYYDDIEYGDDGYPVDMDEETKAWLATNR